MQRRTPHQAFPPECSPARVSSKFYTASYRPSKWKFQARYRDGRIRRSPSCPRRCEERQSTLYASRRVCSRRNRTRPRRSPRRAKHQTSHRYWPLQGQTRWRKITAAQKGYRLRKDSPAGGTRLAKGSPAQTHATVAHPLPSSAPSSPA